jgi:hypothetical protein
MADNESNNGTLRYQVREVVGVFADFEMLEATVDELEVAGFDRSKIATLATDERIKERVGRLYRTVGEIEDDGQTPRAAFVSKDSRIEGEAAAVGIPFYIGCCAGAFEAHLCQQRRLRTF